MSNPRGRFYSVILHGLLIALALATLFLARESQKLRRQLTTSTESSSLIAGQEIEPFTVQGLDGWEEEIDPAASGGHSRLLFFFSTECAACQENQERWTQLARRLGPETDVIGVSLDSTEATREYRDRQGLPFRVVTLLDPARFAATEQVSAVPFTLHLRPDGRVRDSWVGVLSDRDVEDIVMFPTVAAGS